jgi:hypothetical protein
MTSVKISEHNISLNCEKEDCYKDDCSEMDKSEKGSACNEHRTINEPRTINEYYLDDNTILTGDSNIISEISRIINGNETISSSVW